MTDLELRDIQIKMNGILTRTMEVENMSLSMSDEYRHLVESQCAHIRHAVNKIMIQTNRYGKDLNNARFLSDCRVNREGVESVDGAVK